MLTFSLRSRSLEEISSEHSQLGENLKGFSGGVGVFSLGGGRVLSYFCDKNKDCSVKVRTNGDRKPQARKRQSELARQKNGWQVERMCLSLGRCSPGGAGRGGRGWPPPHCC